MSHTIDALLTEGPRPDYHRAALNNLRETWPVLWNAIIRDASVAESRKLMYLADMGRKRE